MSIVTKPSKAAPYAILNPDSGESLTSIDPELVKGLYKKFGAILFRGYDLDVKTFKELTDIYCSHGAYNNSKGRELIDKDYVIQTVNLGTEPFPLHPEMSAVPWKPDICWFACETPPTREGGETTVCDGIEIVKNLPHKLTKTLKKRKLLYVMPTDIEEIKYWLNTDQLTPEAFKNIPEDCPYTFFKRPDGAYSIYNAPVLHKPMFSKELCYGNFLLFARYLNNRKNFPLFENGEFISDEISEAIKEAGDKAKIAHSWEKGDILMLDNSRFLHGRNEVSANDERYIMTYFGYINFAELTKKQKVERWRQEGFFHRHQLTAT